VIAVAIPVIHFDCVLCAAMDAKLLDDEFEQVKKTLEEKYGTAEDDKLETNEKLDAFIEEMGDANFYVYTTLLVLDPNQEFETVRSVLKMILLPLFQMFVPFGMLWYFIVQKDMINDNGYCCNHTNPIFRFTGFVTFMYSGWQIIDGCDDAASKFLMKKAAHQWQRAGMARDFKATWMFFVSHTTQQVCCILILYLTYIIYTTQCDTPLDLLMNCVAVNFVLDIDTEWMDDSKQAKSVVAATWYFKQMRDVLKDNEAEVRSAMQTNKGARNMAPKLDFWISHGLETFIVASAYVLVVVWTFCPGSY